ncbi:MAG TPA: cytochrome o ubiquinol oxidase subunit IV [Candidatus Eisenbacteria bacterium]|nr:cytochrome o ubiquinol oxidase subunit IV [Candidatus Eisenbacteria bacterium]
MKNHTTIKAYITGFVLSLALTLLAYCFVVYHIFTGIVLTTALIELAFIQLLVQLLFFLHLGQESRPRWNLIFFLLTFGVLLLVMVGSLWIMNNLNYNMTPVDMSKTIIEDEGIAK